MFSGDLPVQVGSAPEPGGVRPAKSQGPHQLLLRMEVQQLLGRKRSHRPETAQQPNYRFERIPLQEPS